ncbi:acyl transferase [Galbibacter pacificus]|uniref:Acyl transferase n=1 Tax=Galbibacter pacificus TaxID=2996052 RepID=A0ABT6FWD1_9FLAO|nr:acyl transferase [Galbibacter pacificus]MDG3583980.1 acyl transferase [Galbibacter pacificus]MDG3587583.1 acyl transferase [Galbibacter pacificus]
MDTQAIFNIKSKTEFHETALQVFKYQYQNNAVYQDFCNHLKRTPNNVFAVEGIPFLPIQFFKSHRIVCNANPEEIIFTSSGTTGSTTSKHFVTNVKVYEESFRKGFSHFYGSIREYSILALLPAYLERKGSSLIYMVNDMIEQSNASESGFYLNNLDELAQQLSTLDKMGRKVLLIGVSFALLDLIEKYQFNLKNTIVMETGGMKGRRKEMIRQELHALLCKGFGVEEIHSEYGMTELLSQGYSNGKGIFECPPWMKILTRDTEDPLTVLDEGKTGGINVIDLANINSCAFIATQDLGRVKDNKYEIIGRFDNSDIRGCNLMVL